MMTEQFVVWTDDVLIDLLTIPSRVERTWFETAVQYVELGNTTTWDGIHADLVSYGSDIVAVLHREQESELTEGLERRLKLVTALLNRIMLLNNK